MARHYVGGGTQDWVFVKDAEGDAAPTSVTVTFWDTAEGGMQYTDLLDNIDTPISSIDSDVNGFFGKVQLPDGTPWGPRGAYADANGGNGPRRWVDAHSIGEETAANSADLDALGSKGVANGLASLDANGLVPVSQLPEQQVTTGVSSVNSKTGAVTLDALGVSAVPLVRYRPRMPLPRAPLSMVTVFQAGHGWIGQAFGEGCTVEPNDTTDFMLGSQSANSFLACVGGSTDRTNWDITGLAPVDVTGKRFAVLVKVSDQAALNQLTLKMSATGDFTNDYQGIDMADGGTSISASLPSGRWTWLYGSLAEPVSGATGTDITAVTSWQVWANADAPCTINFGAVAYFDDSPAFPNGVVTFNFDDSYDTQWTAARAVMDQFGYPGVAATIVEALGTAGCLTLDQLHNLKDNHGWEITGHAYAQSAHQGGYGELTPTALETEVGLLRGWLAQEEFSGIFRYPLADGPLNVIEAVGSKFDLALKGNSGKHQTKYIGAPLEIRTRGVKDTDTLADVQAHVDAAKTHGLWLILGFHRIAETANSAITWPTADLQSLCAYLDAQGVPVRTISEVIEATRGA